MATSRKCGISITELLIAAVLLSFVLAIGGKVFVSGQKELSDSQKSFDVESAVAIFSGHLQKFLASGDIRFFAFSTLAGESAQGRWIFPQVNKCANLTNCTDTDSLLYVHYDKTTTPAIQTACYLPVSEKFVVDISNRAYGEPTFLPNQGFNVSSLGSGLPQGKVFMKAPTPDESHLVALFNPPFASMWLVDSAPQPLTKSSVSNPSNPSEFTPEFQTYCANNIDGLNVATKWDDLYSVDVKPFTLRKANGSTSSTSQIQRNTIALSGFPLRTFNIEVRSIGVTDPNIAESSRLSLLK